MPKSCEGTNPHGRAHAAWYPCEASGAVSLPDQPPNRSEFEWLLRRGFDGGPASLSRDLHELAVGPIAEGNPRSLACNEHVPAGSAKKEQHGLRKRGRRDEYRWRVPVAPRIARQVAQLHVVPEQGQGAPYRVGDENRLRLTGGTEGQQPI